MNSNKIAVRFARIFAAVFSAAFFILAFAVIVSGYENEQNSDTYNCSTIQHLIIVFSAACLTALFLLAYRFLKDENRLKDSLINNRKIVLLSVGTMFVLQLAVGWLLLFKPVTDMEIIQKYIDDFARTGNFDLIREKMVSGEVYLIRYPNNLAMTFLLSGVCRLWYLITGEVSNAPALVLNVIAINASVLLTVKFARRFMGMRSSMFVLLLCVLFAPFYTYVSYYYTDSLSMPFVIGAVYLVTSAEQSGGKKRIAMFAGCGVILLLGFKLKGSVIIVLVGAVIYLVLKLKFKQLICALLALVIGFSASFAAWNAIYRSSGIITAEESYEYEYPPTHWVMMGLKGYGHYNLEDSNYTKSFSGKDAKNEADLRRIKERLNKMGASGLISHLARKTVWTWEDGTYFISHHIENAENPNILHDFILQDGKYHFVFYAYSCGFQIFLIFMMAFSGFGVAKRRKLPPAVMLQSLVFGLLLFLLIWETRSRYLYNFTPLFIVLAADGIETAESLLFRRSRDSEARAETD